VARDRKRAKQRRDRRAGRAPARGTTQAVPTPPLPGDLEHASANVDEFDAALARGAEGTATPLPEAAEVPAPALDRGELAQADSAAEDRLDERALASDGGGVGDGGVGGDGGLGDDGALPGEGGRGAEPARERASGAPLPSGNRVVAFLRASWAELQRVQWPDRRQVTQATAVVLGFVAVAGLYLGAADFVAKEIVEFVL
jgi:preprotein translocase SecE subunit